MDNLNWRYSTWSFYYDGSVRHAMRKPVEVFRCGKRRDWVSMPDASTMEQFMLVWARGMA